MVKFSIIIFLLTKSIENSWEIRDFIGFNNKTREENERFENNWNLIIDKKYYIRVSLYDEKDNKLYLPINTRIKVSHNFV